MSLAVLKSRALSGMDAPEVIVEVHLANGLPSFTIVGLPEAEVKESKDRVRAALQTAQFEFPARRITVNLAPADLPKESGRYDLPIALGILAASGQIPTESLKHYEIAGELALTGGLRPIRGALAMAVRMVRDHQSYADQPEDGESKDNKSKAIENTCSFILPYDSAAEAALVSDAVILPAKSLLEVCAHLSGHTVIAPYQATKDDTQLIYPDFSEVKGQSLPKRALEIAAAGGHSILMAGPPGTGKSMLASRFPGILPAMTEQEALESAAVQSINGSYRKELWRHRPFRSPHHTASGVALVGGGGIPRPGEISLAHHGVLFLDELPEFDRKVLEVLREPLESGHITISRAARQADFPASFQLLAAMNPCPCGYLGHHNNKCRCTPDQVSRYKSKISGPLLDRIDLHIEVPALTETELTTAATGETSASIRNRVEQARAIQLARQGKANFLLGSKEVDQYCLTDDAGLNLLKQAIAKLNLSARAYHRILKVARTIADLANEAMIKPAHIADTELDAKLSQLFSHLAQDAESQALLWQKIVLESGTSLLGEGSPELYQPDLRARIVACLIRKLGARRIKPVLAATKIRGLSAFSNTKKSSNRQSGFHPTPSSVDDVGASHRGIGKSGGLRAAVFGVNDGLVSVACLVLGVAGAAISNGAILITGIAGLLAGAFSMAAGEYISMRSQREMFEYQISLERAELAQYPEEEANELTLIYMARGMHEEEARALAQRMIADPEMGLDILAREELGLNPDELGSPWLAAGASFLAFMLGGLIPLIPFLLQMHQFALQACIGLTALTLFGVGMALSLYSGRSALWGGTRMLLIGGLAGAMTYLIGNFMGTTLT